MVAVVITTAIRRGISRIPGSAGQFTVSVGRSLTLGRTARCLSTSTPIRRSEVDAKRVPRFNAITDDDGNVIRSGHLDRALMRLDGPPSQHVGQPMVLAGWLTQIRIISHYLAFAVLLLPRGRGCVQLVVRKDKDSKENPVSTVAALWQQAGGQGVVQVEGQLVERPEQDKRYEPRIDQVDPNYGRYEFSVERCTLLNSVPSETLPFDPSDQYKEAREEVRMRNRHLDLRSPRLGNNIRLRSRVTWAARQYLHDQGFDEVETPVLLRSTPEGAREYLVPTRRMSQAATDESSGNEVTSYDPHFFALQQSPQQPKQLLMVSGVTDRYYQIARCFRDEGGRKDRQPEFTQIDLEMSFIQGVPDEANASGDVSSNAWTLGGGEIKSVVEGLICAIWKAAGRGEEVKQIEGEGIAVMTYDEAMNRFGSDKPDLRYGLELVKLSDVLLPSEQQADAGEETEEFGAEGEVEILCFHPPSTAGKLNQKRVEEMLKANDVTAKANVEAFWVDADAPNAAARLLLLKSHHIRQLLQRHEIDAEQVSVDSLTGRLVEAQQRGALIHADRHPDLNFAPAKGQLTSPSLARKMCVFVASRPSQNEGGATVLGEVRRALMAQMEALAVLQPARLDLLPPAFTWIVDFPLFTADDPDKDFLAHGRWSSTHHPFTSPKVDDLPRLRNLLEDQLPGTGGLNHPTRRRQLGQIRGQHYDLVLDGQEIGGGSVRIHDATLQRTILEDVLQLGPAEVRRFDHLLRALAHGAPPHGGIALGLDRLMAILCRTASIRDVVAFPKSNTGRDLLFGSPDPVEVATDTATGSREGHSMDQTAARKMQQDKFLLQYGLQSAKSNA